MAKPKKEEAKPKAAPKAKAEPAEKEVERPKTRKRLSLVRLKRGPRK